MRLSRRNLGERHCGCEGDTSVEFSESQVNKIKFSISCTGIYVSVSSLKAKRDILLKTLVFNLKCT